MTYHYTDTTREADAHALPDVEVFGPDDWGECPSCEASILLETWYDGGCPHCSVANNDHEYGGDPLSSVKGYGYAFGFPGCLWDSDPLGPFDTEAEALAVAREAAGCCEHGIPEDGDVVCEECPAPELWAIRTQWRDGLGWFVSFLGGDGFGRVTRPSSDHAICWASEDAARPYVGMGETTYRLTDAEARRWGR